MGVCYENNNKNLQIIRGINLKRTVKSFYIIKDIFSFLSEKKKLEIIEYNKKLKELLGITLENYKKLSGKYIIGKRNGKGEEYTLDSNIKIFEGKYLNGKKNGKGKEFNDIGSIIFEGEYLNGKRAAGKGFNKKGKVILIIEKNGKGKEFFGNGKLKYPVGLITSDEVLYAGGQYHEVDPNNYYNSWALIDVAYWSMTPQSVSKMLYPNSKGYINRNNMTATSGVRPVVAIDGETMLTGDGTRNNPYRVPIDVNYTVETDDYLESDVEVAIEDQTVNITIKGKKGYDFVKFRFYDENGEEKNIAVEGDRKAAHFQMPNYNIRVESVWQKRANPETSTQSNKLGLLLLLISISNIVVITKKIICKQ